MAININTLKNWFKNGLKPTQEQFWNWMDSYWHKDEAIAMINIDGLSDVLSKKADTKALTYYAKTDASNLSNDNIISWKSALGVGDLPTNIATVDEGDKTGNVYTKTQTDANFYKKLKDPGDGKTYVLNIDGSAVDASNFGKVDKVMNIAPDANKNVDISGVAMTWTNQHRFSNINDKKSDVTYNRIGGYDAQGNMAVIGFPAVRQTFSDFSKDQLSIIAQLLNGGAGSIGDMYVNNISPPIVQNRYDTDESILLTGANLKLSTQLSSVSILASDKKTIVATIPGNQVTITGNGFELYFKYNFKNFPVGQYFIRLQSNGKEYITSLDLKIVEDVENINLNAITWDRVQNPSANISTDNIALGATFVLASEAGVGTTLPILSYKSSELFAEGEDFYIEIKITMPSKGGKLASSDSRIKVGIGYSSSTNALVSKNIVFSSIFLWALQGIGYANNYVTAYQGTDTQTFSVVFIKTGNLFRTKVGNSNQSMVLSNNSGYSIFLELDQLDNKYSIQGQIIKAFKFK